MLPPTHLLPFQVVPGLLPFISSPTTTSQYVQIRPKEYRQILSQHFPFLKKIVKDYLPIAFDYIRIAFDYLLHLTLLLRNATRSRAPSMTPAPALQVSDLVAPEALTSHPGFPLDSPTKYSHLP